MTGSDDGPPSAFAIFSLVVTVDLDPAARGDYSAKILRGDGDVGRVHQVAAGASKVTQILIDPTAEAPAALLGLEGSVDLTFIDGDHSHESVKNDTELAMLLARRDAVFLWHDFYRFPAYIAEGAERRGVYPYLNTLARGGDLTLFHISGTYLVVGRRDWGWDIPSTLYQPSGNSEVMAERIVRLAEF